MRKAALGFVVIALSVWGFTLKADACNLTVEPGQSIQAAINNLPKDNSTQTICLAEGDFMLKHLLSIERSNVILKGKGDKTHLQLQDGVEEPVLVIGEYKVAQPRHAVSNITVENLRITGNKSQHEFMPSIPYLSNSGVVVRKGEHIALKDLTVATCRSACLLTEQHTKDVLIENSHISGAHWDGVSFNSTAQVTMRNNVVENNVAAAITAENVEDSKITGNQLSNNGSHGVYLSNSYRNLFANNNVRNNKLSGVFLTCAIRTRNPVMCWDNSMSGDNTFKNNLFKGNSHSFSIGADTAANCAKPGFKVNVWENNSSDSASQPYPQSFGRCTTGKDSGTRTAER
ncbi:right-handed parallel beta-helix repeat-containing protein [Gallaecimonas mangrovi]|uniref:right-handed parallel beta-helix repeat-containing protein n=1 Tax=Gallaecimonas mangrovi TaxID=2291597 RepID=UPI000E209C2C|nr:right-handed parallel beta-helix repeat-containing protein [Gallaecimonas mangrovi]